VPRGSKAGRRAFVQGSRSRRRIHVTVPSLFFGTWAWAARACCPRRSSSAAATRPWPSSPGPQPRRRRLHQDQLERERAGPGRPWTRCGTRSRPGRARISAGLYADLATTIAEIYGVSREHVIVGTDPVPSSRGRRGRSARRRSRLPRRRPMAPLTRRRAALAPGHMITVSKSLGPTPTRWPRRPRAPA
jgi:hypothetical protein